MQLTAGGRARLAASSGSPDSCDSILPDRRIAEACQRHGVGFVAGAQYLSDRDYKAREGIHWNERGHRRMGTVLAALHESFRGGTLTKYVPQPDATGVGVLRVQPTAFIATETAG